VPLDPSSPAGHIAWIVADLSRAARDPVVITLDRFRGMLPEGCRMIRMDADGERPAGAGGADAAGASPDDLAYVLYTSGSTGRPKGVMVSHRAIGNQLDWLQDVLQLDTSDRLLQQTPVIFDVSVCEIFLPLATGARLVLAEPAGHRDSAYLVRMVAEHGITVLQLVPSLLQILLEEESLNRCTSLRLVSAGGEAMPAVLPRLLASRLGLGLFNRYGPTEAAIDASCRPFRDTERATVPLGRPISGVRLYVLDPHLQPVAIGVPGELGIAGAGLARGYLGRPDLTAERFVPNPLAGRAGDPGARLYRTGDRVRRLHDGELEFLGRLDHQVKIRGYRIELGEIETAARRFPAVREAVVVAADGNGFGPRLVGFLVPRDGGIDLASCRALLAASLPEYMVPSVLVETTDIPRLPSGKVDRRELALRAPRPESVRAVGATLPRYPLEEMLATIFAEVLGLESVGTEDGFFDLGGHSLLAMRLVSRIRVACGVEVPVREVFDHPTVVGLAAVLLRRLQSSSRALVPAIEPVPRDAPLPLSFAQQRLWFIEQMLPGIPAYNIPMAFRLRGGLDAEVLKASLKGIVARHEALRTTFRVEEGKPGQVISPSSEVALPVVDLRALPHGVRPTQALRLAGEEARRPFDLARGPLLRAGLLVLGEADQVVLLSMHHIVSDAWSMDILVRELGAFYGALSRGLLPSLPPLPVQYADFAGWQRRWLSGEVLEAELSYWRSQLGGAPPALELPTDRSRPAVQTWRGATRPLSLPSGLGAELRALSRRQGTTLFMTLLAGFQALLHRYTGQEKIAVGTPIAGRTQVQTEGLIGFFVNTLVLCADVGRASGFSQLLTQVREATLGAYAHQDLPFEKLVGELQPERDLSRSPLFQVVFALQNATARALDLTGLSLEPVVAETGAAKFDLILSLAASADRLFGGVEFNRDLFDAATALRLTGHFEQLLWGAVGDPGSRLAELPILSVVERHQIFEWNATAEEHDREATLLTSFAAMAAAAPDRLAASLEDRGITYGELERRANRVARRLRRSVWAPGALVGLCLEPCLEMVVGLLGIFKTGAAYVPLDPAYPRDRLTVLAEGLAASITVERFAGKLPEQALLRLDSDAAEIAAESAEPLAGGPTAGGLAYVIYTSGSTGRPKGVAIDHRGAVNTIVDINRRFRVGPGDRVLALSSLGFDLSVYDLFGMLAAGGAAVLVPADARRDPAAWVELAARHRVSVWNTVPALMEMFVEYLEGRREPLPVSLRLVLMSGDWIPLGLPERIRALAGEVAVVSLGGATEASIWSILFPIGRTDPAWTSIPYGRPMANQAFHVLDGALEPCPIGVPGQLFIGGIGVALGYWQDAERTRANFLHHPRTGERLYRTGDLGRFRSGGTIEFLGRVDHQVKVRGFRIELGEIEVVLTGHPGVREAVAVVREEPSGGKGLVAYVMPRDPAAAPPEPELRSLLEDKLPDYMVPGHIVLLERLPLTDNGKVDHEALPAPERPRHEGTAAGDSPRGSVEEALAEIWRDLLRTESLGIHDNFFALGGDSILSIQVVSRAGQAGLYLTPRQIFEHPTIAGLATLAGELAAPSEEIGEVSGPVPLTPAQRWFLEQELEGPHHFNQAVLLEAVGHLDAALLRRALAHLVARHDALRLRFEAPSPESPERTGWSQWLEGSAEVSLVEIDLSILPEGHRTAALELGAAALQRSLRLDEPPLLHVGLFRTGVQNLLLLIAHHLVIDGVSWRLLLHDLRVIFEQLARRQAPALPPVPASFRRWASRLSEFAASPRAREEVVTYWLRSLEAPAAPLPLDHHQGEDTVDSSRTVFVSLEAEETRALLQDASRAYRTQIDDLLLTALAETFGRWTGSRSLLFDLESHGREEIFPDLEPSRTVGWFTSFYPVRLNLGTAATPGEALKLVKEQLRAVPGKGIGYGVARYLGADDDGRRLRDLPRSQVVFNYLGQLDQAVAAGGLFRPAASGTTGPLRDPRQRRSHLLAIDSAVSGGRLRLSWSYSESRHRRDTVERVAGWFLESLRALLSHCLSPEAGGYTPSDFPLAAIGPAALDRLVSATAATRAMGRIEDLYPLSPVQQGMLFHTLQDPGSGVYVEQLGLTLDVDLDVALFVRAWQELADRHAILRTAFFWDGLEEPLQVVFSGLELDWRLEDWRSLAAAEQRAELAALLAADRRRGFEPSAAPLMRLALVRLGEERYRVLWSHHHLLLDGWSTPILLRDLFASYSAAVAGTVPRLAPPRPFKEYVTWLRGQDLAAAESFWRRALAGFRDPTPLGAVPVLPTATGRSHGEVATVLTAAESEGLRSLARRHQL
ncbi:MAG TPA: amino acid adenylation domain-containing protein, partial [Thermoanaerobaculia bacterium]|nr:amino acid adenylation domain-containing protein [Thermoanaerobaculia bacterium]